MTQTNYIDRMLQRFDFADIYPKATPMITNQVANRERKVREEIESLNEFVENSIDENIPYREAIGSLLYLANASRPDICYTVNVLSRHQNNMTRTEWDMIKQVFGYLKGTRTLGLTYLGKTNDVQAFSDASFADCRNSRTTSGFVVKLYGDSVAWRMCKQNYVALSTCQAEFVSMSDACQELMSLNNSLT